MNVNINEDFTHTYIGTEGRGSIPADVNPFLIFPSSSKSFRRTFLQETHLNEMKMKRSNYLRCRIKSIECLCCTLRDLSVKKSTI